MTSHTNSRIRVLVVDDMLLARGRILRHLAKEGDIDVVGECSSGPDAITAIAELQPDVVFLDVQMPEVGGFEVLEAVGPDAVPVVIFVTAHDEFALQAFEVSAVDYLLKPFTAERFAAAVARARQQLSARTARAVDARLAALLETLAVRTVKARRIALKLDGRTVFVTAGDIDYIEAAGNYVRIVVGPDAHLVRERLTHMAATLDPAMFVRIHRSTIVNVTRIREMQPMFNGDQSIVLRSGTRLTLSRTYRERLLAVIEAPREEA